MPVYRCIKKLKDSANTSTTKFVLQNIQTKETYTVPKDELKIKMTANQVQITNLQIDSQGRLIDKQEQLIQQQSNQSKTPRQLSDMTNRELKDYITQLQETDKITNKKIILILREIMNRCEGLDNGISDLSEQLQMKESNMPEDSMIDTTTQLQAIENYFMENQDNISEIKSSIQDLSTQLSNLTLPVQTQSNTDKSEIKSTKNIIAEDGKLEIPSDEYSQYFYKMYFTPESQYKADQDISSQLKVYDHALPDIQIAPDTIEKLKEEIAKTADAYYKTEEFYNAQYNDYASNIHGSQILALTTGTIAGKFKGVVKTSPVVAKQIGREIYTNVIAKIIPLRGVEDEAKYNQTLNDFKSRSDLTKEQANKLMKEMGGIWNCAVEFIANNPEWEVMLYVIQTMNHMHLKTYKVGENFNHNTVINDKGTMKSCFDASFTDKNANKLTEYSLKQLYENLEKRSAIQDKEYECLKQVYDRFIISYFASKKLLYEKGFYPFSGLTTKEINGAVVVLTEIGLYLSNVSSMTAMANIGSFVTENNNRRNYQYSIVIPSDLTLYM